MTGRCETVGAWTFACGEVRYPPVNENSLSLAARRLDSSLKEGAYGVYPTAVGNRRGGALSRPVALRDHLISRLRRQLPLKGKPDKDGAGL